MDAGSVVGVRATLLGVLQLSLLQSVLTVLHSGNFDGYALPRPLSGCEEHWVDFKVRLNYPNITLTTDISEDFQLALDTPNEDTVLFEFCVQNKTAIHATIDDPVLNWPAGQYCIHSMGKVVKTEGRHEWVLGDCPAGFKSGVTALPFKSLLGQRMLTNTSPVSLLTHPNVTMLHYCCSTDGNVNASIDLGMMAPFILLPYGQPRCQKVQNMDSDLQFIEWPVAEQRWSGSHPYSVGGRKFFYCYYKPMGLGMEQDIVIATFGVALGTPALTIIVICLCKLRAKVMGGTKHFQRFQSVM